MTARCGAAWLLLASLLLHGNLGVAQPPPPTAGSSRPSPRVLLAPPPSPSGPHQTLALSLLDATVRASICMTVDGSCVENLVWVIDLPPYPLTTGTSRNSDLECVGGADTVCRWPTIDSYLDSLATDSFTYIPMQLVVETLNISQTFQMGHTSAAANILRQLRALTLTCSDPVPVYAPYILVPMIMALSVASMDPGYNATSFALAIAAAAYVSPPPPSSPSASSPSNATTSRTANGDTIVSLAGVNTSSDAAFRRLSEMGVSFTRLYAPSSAPSSLLQRLVINDCGLTGQLPPYTSWLQLPNLQHLDLSRNLLSGALPATFGPSPPLTYLNLSRNRITGPLTAELVRYGGCGRTMDLSYNDLRGGLPKAWLRSACTLYGKTSIGLQPRRRLRSLLDRARRLTSGLFDPSSEPDVSTDFETGPGGGRLTFDPSQVSAGMAAKVRNAVMAAAGLTYRSATDTGTTTTTTTITATKSGSGSSSSSSSSAKVGASTSSPPSSTSTPVQGRTEDSSLANAAGSTVTTTFGANTFISGGYAFWLAYPNSYTYGGDNCPMLGVVWDEHVGSAVRNGTGGPDGAGFPFTVLLYGNPRLRTPGGPAAGYATAASEYLYFAVQENACTAFQPLRELLWLWGSFGGCALAVLVAVAVHTLLAWRHAKTRVRPAAGAGAAAKPPLPAPSAAGGNPPPSGPAAAGPAAGPGTAAAAAVASKQPVPTSSSSSSAARAAGTAEVTAGGGTAPADERKRADGQPQQQGPGAKAPLAPAPGAGTAAPVPAGPAAGAQAAPAGGGGDAGMAGLIVVAHARAYSLRAATQRISMFGGAFLDATEAAFIWLIFGIPWGAIVRTIVAIGAHLGATGLTFAMALPARVEYCKVVRKCVPYIFVLVPVLSVVSIGVTLFLMRATRQLAGVMSHRIAAGKAGLEAGGSLSGRASNEGSNPGADASKQAAPRAEGDLWKLRKELEEDDRGASEGSSVGSSSRTEGGGSGDGTGRQGGERWVSGQQPRRTDSSGLPASQPGVLLPSPPPSTSGNGSTGGGGSGGGQQMQRKTASGADSSAPMPSLGGAGARSRQGSPRSPARVLPSGRSFAGGGAGAGAGSTSRVGSREPSPLGRRASTHADEIGPSRLGGSGDDGGGGGGGTGGGAATAATSGARPVAEAMEGDGRDSAAWQSAPGPGASPGSATTPADAATPSASLVTWTGTGDSASTNRSTAGALTDPNSGAAGASATTASSSSSGCSSSAGGVAITRCRTAAPGRSPESSDVAGEARAGSPLADGRFARTTLDFRFALAAASPDADADTHLPSQPAAQGPASALGPRSESRLEAWGSADTASASDDPTAPPAGDGSCGAHHGTSPLRMVSHAGPVCEGRGAGGAAVAEAGPGPGKSGRVDSVAASATGPQDGSASANAAPSAQRWPSLAVGLGGAGSPDAGSDSLPGSDSALPGSIEKAAAAAGGGPGQGAGGRPAPLGVSPQTMARLGASRNATGGTVASGSAGGINPALSASRNLRAGPRNSASSQVDSGNVQEAISQTRPRGAAQLRPGGDSARDAELETDAAQRAEDSPHGRGPAARRPSRAARSLDYSGGGAAAESDSRRSAELGRGSDGVMATGPSVCASEVAGGATGSAQKPSALASRRHVGPPPPIALPSTFESGPQGSVRIAVGSAPGSPSGGQRSKRLPARDNDPAAGPDSAAMTPSRAGAGGPGGNAWLQDRLAALSSMSGAVPTGSGTTRMPSVAAAAAVAAATGSTTSAMTPRRTAAAATGGGAGGGGSAAAAAAAPNAAAADEQLRLQRLSPQALLVVNQYLKDATFGRRGAGLGHRLGKTAASAAAILVWSCAVVPLAAVVALLAVFVVVLHVILRGCVGFVSYIRERIRRRRASAVSPVAVPTGAAAAAVPPASPPPPAAAPGWLARFDAFAAYLRLELALFIGIHTHVAGWLLYVTLSFFTGAMYGLGYLWGKDAVPVPWVFMACNAACLAGALLLLIELACDLPAWEYGVCRYPYRVAVRTAARSASGDGAPEGRRSG